MMNWMGTGTLPPALQERNDVLCYSGMVSLILTLSSAIRKQSKD